MAVIHVLDQHTAELIAAGEVVERPASVVKELLENALDAGATMVTVAIHRGGVSMIQVIDDGSGIEAEYIPTAFVRHATSKIQTEKDLERISTLGFRGEALASIASVSRVEVITRTDVDEFAHSYCIEGGVELGIKPSARPTGTTVFVRDLFYNTPARMKFLKKDVTEANYVSETVSRIALSRPDVSICFMRDGKVMYKTPGDGNLRSAVYAILGKEYAKDLLEVSYENNGYTVRGLITPPGACRASRGMQYFFLNGRFVKNKTMMAALENAYRGTLMQGKFPGGIVMLDMPADLVDVNVHPAKIEVRFARESDVFDTIYSGVKNALGAALGMHQKVRFSEPAQEKPMDTGSKKKEPPVQASYSFASKTFHLSTDPSPVNQPWTQVEGKPQSQSQSEPSDSVREVYKGVLKYSLPHKKSMELPLYNGMQKMVHSLDNLDVEPEPESRAVVHSSKITLPLHTGQIERIAPPEESVSVPQMNKQAPVVQMELETESISEAENKTPDLIYVGEVFKTYIITQREQELCLIDKHAAHERLLYEKLVQSYGNVSAQLLLTPITVHLSAPEKTALLDHEDLLRDAGLEVEDFGANTVLVRSVPADVLVESVEQLVCELAQKLLSGAKDALSEKTEWVLHSLACRSAIKAGDKSAEKELLVLAKRILDGEVPPFCPHGRPVVLKLTKKELEKQFGRLG